MGKSHVNIALLRWIKYYEHNSHYEDCLFYFPRFSSGSKCPNKNPALLLLQIIFHYPANYLQLPNESATNKFIFCTSSRTYLLLSYYEEKISYN